MTNSKFYSFFKTGKIFEISPEMEVSKLKNYEQLTKNKVVYNNFNSNIFGLFFENLEVIIHENFVDCIIIRMEYGNIEITNGKYLKTLNEFLNYFCENEINWFIYSQESFEKQITLITEGGVLLCFEFENDFKISKILSSVYTLSIGSI